MMIIDDHDDSYCCSRPTDRASKVAAAQRASTTCSPRLASSRSIGVAMNVMMGGGGRIHHVVVRFVRQCQSCRAIVASRTAVGRGCRYGYGSCSGEIE
jgi:hypothetical protein